MTGTEPTLKCVITWSDRRNLCSLVSEMLKSRMPPDEIQSLGDDSLVVCSTSEPSDVRDWIASVIDEDESALVVEFERWSSFGPGVDAAWFLRRGH